jgi:polar amino acid transport system substrate-binding protein
VVQPSPRRPSRRGLGVAALLLLAGCGTLPRDAAGTLDRVRGGVLRAGATEHDGRVAITDDGTVSGPEADLVTAFAASLDAQVEWTTGSEAHLVSLLERGGLDLVVGGFDTKTPWAQQVAATRPYDVGADVRGRKRDLVLLTRKGENGFLVELETWLPRKERS